MMSKLIRIIYGYKKFVFGILIFIGIISCLVTFQLTIENNLKTDDRHDVVLEYTLPSMKDVANSVVDLDFQAAIQAHGQMFKEVPEGSPRINIIIASTWRSGSTLLGEILSSYPGVYYHYEPLMHKGIVQVTSRDIDNGVTNFLSNLLNCDYRSKTSYLNFAFATPEVFSRNMRLWRFCSVMPRFKCYVSEILGKLCSLFPIHVMKLVRVRLSDLEPLMKNNENTKVILLTRDPRAVMSSRTINVDWCKTDHCRNSKVLCSYLFKDATTYRKLKEQYPNNIILLRYEDLAKNVYNKTEMILKFVGLSMHKTVKEYLKTHLESDFEAPWSTIHDPKKQITKWMRSTPWNQVILTQYYCRPVMKLLGYRPFDSKQDLTSGNYVLPLLNID